MGKKGSQKKGQNVSNLPPGSVTLREESTGKKQANVNVKSILKVQHIKNLATWASGEASIPSLGAFYGHCLAACAEALGTPADPSLFTCQRCESILQPGSNCTIRIEKNRPKVHRKRKNSKLLSQNNLVYKCHFCLHRNSVRGTPKGHMKELCPPKTKSQPPKNALPKSAFSGNDEAKNKDKAAPGRSITENVEVAPIDLIEDDMVLKSPVTPVVKEGITLLEARSKKTNRSKSKKSAESENSSVMVDAEKTVSVSSKRRRKSWTSLKEKAESSDQVYRQNMTNLTVPFFM